MSLPSIITDLQQGLDGDPWFGSAVLKLLAGVAAEQAARKPGGLGGLGGDMHSIWEIVLHMTAWQNEVRRRVQGNPPGQPAEGDWPAVPQATEANWQTVKAALSASLLGLITELRSFPEDRLDEMVGAERNPPLGSGVTFGVMLRGLAQHNAYHAGQIAIVKKLLAG